MNETAFKAGHELGQKHRNMKKPSPSLAGAYAMRKPEHDLISWRAGYRAGCFENLDYEKAHAAYLCQK